MINKQECDLCGKKISNANFKRHRGSKNCLNPYNPIEQIINEDMTCIYCNNKFSSTNKLRNHQLRCKLNPDYENRMDIYKNSEGFKNRKINNQYTKAEELGIEKPKMSEEHKEKIRKANLGRVHSEYSKKLISEKMRKAHKEGRAWNIGKSRWKNKKSYPEKYFTTYFNNELEDKEFRCEYPVDIYSLDFAWLHKKKCIEIDGEQHYRFEEYKERDKRKDNCLELNGWKILRIRWTEFLKDKESFKPIIKKFIDN